MLRVSSGGDSGLAIRGDRLLGSGDDSFLFFFFLIRDPIFLTHHKTVIGGVGVVWGPCG